MIYIALINEICERTYNIPVLYRNYYSQLDELIPGPMSRWKKKLAFIISLFIYYSAWMENIPEDDSKKL
jgi:hypothetical protein